MKKVDWGNGWYSWSDDPEPELDIEKLKQTIGGLRWILEQTEQRGLPSVSLEVGELRTIIAALDGYVC